MTYSVKELFYTLQGEGMNAGKAAVFCRFAGCNLWSGRESDRATAQCRFCDTDFVGVDGMNGNKFADADSLADAVLAQWHNEDAQPFVVCTGGEPLLQLDAPLIEALHQRGIQIAIETNGTLAVPAGIDWICVSPKGSAKVVVTQGDELKLVYPQAEAEAQPACFEHLDFAHFLLQPLDDAQQRHNMQRATEYCMQHPRWRLSLQTHKWLGIP